MKRIFLFLVTNLAVLALLGLMVFIIEQVFGVRLGQGGTGGLLVFAAIFGFGDLAGTGSMIGALETLKRSHGEPMPPQMQAFGVNTGETGGFMRLFMSHPPLDSRIAALRSAKA
jgi:hypothetical protein